MRLLGLLETLTTPHSVDRYLELVAPMLTVRDIRAEVVAVQHNTADSVTLTLRPTRQWTGFKAGQFVQVGVVIDGVRHTRCYSPAASEYTNELIELTVKAHADGLVSQYLKRHASVGLVVSLSQAEGTFRLPTGRPDRIVLISGGSGITPVMSMLRTLLDENYGGDVVFLHYADSPEHVAYRAELAELANVELKYPAVHGFFDETHLPHWWRDAQTYLCGPAPLMNSVRALYEVERLGERLHTEEFTPAVVAAPGEAGGTVEFSSSGVRVENTGAALLDQAEAAGLTPEYGCRMGICFSCTAVRRSGCTRNLRTGDLDSDPDQPIQLCISAPVGDVQIDI